MAYSHLKLAFDRGGGAKGLEGVLSEKQQDGNARVTKHKYVFTKLSHYSTCSKIFFYLEPIISVIDKPYIYGFLLQYFFAFYTRKGFICKY